MDDRWQVMDGEPGREVVPVETVSGALGGIVVWDDSAQWVAWEAAREAWLAAKKRKSGSRDTVRAYTTAMRQFEAWARARFGRPEMLVWSVITSAVAQEWVAWLEGEGRVEPEWAAWLEEAGAGEVALDGRRVKGLSTASVNLKLAALSSFYDFVRKRYVVPTPDGQGKALWPADRANPFDSVERGKVVPFSNAKFLTPAEIGQVLAGIDTSNLVGKRDFALLYCYAHTCRRFRELINLKWGDLEPLSTGDYAFSYRCKGGEMKKAVLNRKCFAIICSYLRADGRPPEEMEAGDFIFVALYPERITRLPGWEDREVDPNRPISNSTANRILKKRAARVGVDLERAHIHGLRHGGLRLRREEMEASGGVDYEELMTLAGHASLEMTMGYSKRVLEEPQDRTGDAAAERLLRGKGRRRRKAPPGEQMELL